MKTIYFGYSHKVKDANLIEIAKSQGYNISELNENDSIQFANDPLQDLTLNFSDYVKISNV